MGLTYGWFVLPTVLMPRMLFVTVQMAPITKISIAQLKGKCKHFFAGCEKMLALLALCRATYRP